MLRDFNCCEHVKSCTDSKQIKTTTGYY